MKQLAGDAESAIRNIARLAQPAVVVEAEPARSNALLWFALGALAAGAAFLAGALLG